MKTKNFVYYNNRRLILKGLIEVLFTFLIPTTRAFECDSSHKICETSLIVEHRLTMRHPVHQAVYPSNGKIYKYDVKNISMAEPIPLDEVITVDGWEEPRMVLVANASLPGPPLIVYKDQKVIVHVINKLLSDTISIHWHGIPQNNNIENDGVAHVTQCPILPGQNFTYRFIAEPAGTFWYHSHSGNQRTDGLYGALIIRDTEKHRYDEHIIMLQEWNHRWDKRMDFYQYVNGIFKNRKKMDRVYKLDGDFFGRFEFHSGLINGRGRFRKNDQENNGSPLETYVVVKGKTYKFRIISAATILPFRLSIDNHNITVISSDGYDIEQVTAESVIIQTGERYDVLLHADKDIGNYWIRAQTLEVDFDHRAEAILRYEGAEESEPTSSRMSGSNETRCLVVNCPFPYYPEDSFTDCLWVDKLRSKSPIANIPKAFSGKLQEFFLNFGFPGTTWFPATVNGKFLQLPHNSEFGNTAVDCGKSNCGEEKLCICTHTLNLKYGDVTQFIFTNFGKGFGGTHPIHMHGYSFYVLKMGYGVYNDTTGKYLGQNSEIECSNTVDKLSSFCNKPRWANSSWLNGNVPGLELKRPIRKDNVIIPVGGYVVVRIKADNPGLWMLHCHVDLHELHGMALILNVSHHGQRQHFPVCGRKISTSVVNESKSNMDASGNFIEEDIISSPTFWIITGILASMALIELFIIVYICVRKTKSANFDAFT